MDSSTDLTTWAAPLADLVEQGGPVVVILLSLSVFALALALAKLAQFALLGIDRHGRAKKALALWIDGRREEAAAAVARDRSVLGEVVALLMRGATVSGASEQRLREDIERVCLNRSARLRRFLRPLDMIAQTAPLIGLFGTVLGMIEAFRAMQQAGAAVDPSVLAGGIWVALLTTAVGLAVAIPASAFVGWCDGRIEREQSAMEEAVLAFFSGAPTERVSGKVVPIPTHKGERSHAL